MPEIDASLAPQLITTCSDNAAEIADALGRALGSDLVVKPGGPEDPADNTPQGAGLAVLLTFGEGAIAATLPADSGLVPDWVKTPDPTGQSKLSTLAQELSLLLVPDELEADKHEAAWIDDLAAAIERSEPGNDALALPLEVAAGEQLGSLRLIWPLTAAENFLPAGAGASDIEQEVSAPEGEAEQEEAADTPADEADADEPTTKTARILRNFPAPRDYRDLPPNTVSMLQVQVPVSATLASKKFNVNEIIEIGPGSILTFDKSCEALLEVSVAGQPVAEGEAVKVGERFGVRLRRMILPVERFRPMLPPDDEAAESA